MIMEEAPAQLAELRRLGLDELRLRWRANFGRTAPHGLTRQLLFSLFAYRLQAEMLGDLSLATVHILDRASRSAGRYGVPLPSPAKAAKHPAFRPGTVLVREHNGVSHRVMIAESGYVWNGKSFGNLSQVAKAITGTNWNGPRFFGLRPTGENT